MDILKQSIKAVIKQGERSVTGGLCMYKNYNLKCAIGHLITNEHYSEAIEGRGLAFGNRVYTALTDSLGYEVSQVELAYLRRIQRAHDDSDGSDFVSEFKERIRNYINNELLPKELRELVS